MLKLQLIIIAIVAVLFSLLSSQFYQDEYFWTLQGVAFKRLFTYYYNYDIRWKILPGEILVVAETNAIDSISFYFVDLKKLQLIDSVKFSFNTKIIDITGTFDVEKKQDTVFIFFTKLVGSWQPKGWGPDANQIVCLQADLKNKNYLLTEIFTHDTTTRNSVLFLDAEFDSENKDLYVFWTVFGTKEFGSFYKIRKNGVWSDRYSISYTRWLGSVQIIDIVLPNAFDLLIDEMGKFHVVGIYGGIQYGLSLDSGKTWNSQNIYSTNVLDKIKLLKDYSGTLHLLFSLGSPTEYGGYGLPDKILHSYSTDGGKTWTNPADITRSLPTPKVVGLSFDAAVDSWDRVHLVFDAEIKGIAYIYHTYWNGRRWLDFQKLDFTFEGGIVNLNVDEYNNLHLVYSSKRGGGLVYSTGTPQYYIEIPKSFKIYQNYPNPFNTETTIQFSIYKYAHVIARVYDTTGRLIATLIDSDKRPGTYQLKFNGSNLSSGMYILEFDIDGVKEFKKMLLIK